MYDDLALTLNAQFYRANENASDADFEAILDAAVENAFPGSIMVDDLRIAVGRGRNRYRYSLRVFKARRPVYFCHVYSWRTRFTPLSSCWKLNTA